MLPTFESTLLIRIRLIQPDPDRLVGFLLERIHITADQVEAEHNAALEALTPGQRRALIPPLAGVPFQAISGGLR